MSPGGLLLLQELSAESKKGAELHGAAQSGGGGWGGWEEGDGQEEEVEEFSAKL